MIKILSCTNKKNRENIYIERYYRTIATGDLESKDKCTICQVHTINLIGRTKVAILKTPPSTTPFTS